MVRTMRFCSDDEFPIDQAAAPAGNDDVHVLPYEYCYYSKPQSCTHTTIMFPTGDSDLWKRKLKIMKHRHQLTDLRF